MIKRCTAYKVYCDACGARLGGILVSRSVAQVYAAAMGYTSADLQNHFCSTKCRERLEKHLKEKVKKGE